MIKIARDKLLHAGAGFLIGVAGSMVHPALGAAAAAAAGYAKEARDRKAKEGHTFDGWDAYATAVGGAVGTAVSAIGISLGCFQSLL